jgi:CRP-like cAMP-binding protein
MATLSTLKKSPLFKGFSDADFEKVAAFCVDRPLAAGDTVFAEGDEAKAFYLVENGTVIIKKTSSRGDESMVNFGGGSHFGELGLLGLDGAAEKRSASAEATEAGKVLEIPNDAFTKFLEASPSAGLHFYRNLAVNLAGRIRRTTEDLVGLRALRLRNV